MNANFSVPRVVPNVIARKKPRFPTKKRNASNRKPNNRNQTRRGKGSLGLGMERLPSNMPPFVSINSNQSQNTRRGKGGLGLGMERLHSNLPPFVSNQMQGVGKSQNTRRGKGGLGIGKNLKRLHMLGIPLISNNSNRNSGNGNGDQRNGNGNEENDGELDAENIRMSIVRAITKKDNETLSHFLETYPDYIDITNDDGETPLFFAVTRNNEDAVYILLANNADINHQNNAGETPLFIAAQENNAQMVDLLLSLGANPDLESEFGEKPINIAASQGYAKLIPKFPRLDMPKDVHIRLAVSDTDFIQYIPDGVFESISDSVYYAAKDVMANPNLCVGIGKTFMEGSYENATHLIIVEDAEGTVLGASSLQVNYDNDWFEIDLFCSDYRYKGVGSHMMDAIKKLKTHWDRKIKLKSVNDAHNFYIKHGFTNNAAPKTANGLTLMTYS